MIINVVECIKSLHSKNISLLKLGKKMIFVQDISLALNEFNQDIPFVTDI